jgi:two-component system cell cycle sensor histidine kinase/response regulator CckA
VDDDDAVRTLLAAVLASLGYESLTASDGVEALALFKTHQQRISAILLDVRMPTLDGPQTLAAIREVDPGVRAAFVTGFQGEYSEAELMLLGAAAVLSKPFRVEELRDVLAELHRPA